MDIFSKVMVSYSLWQKLFRFLNIFSTSLKPEMSSCSIIQKRRSMHFKLLNNGLESREEFMRVKIFKNFLVLQLDL